ncbi:septum site-determining protein MinC [Methylobacterium sp. CG09_land_8_20_14_0_10_71_15]|uniref:septum site-determining protein MinC n=1 Tax=Methylobacterium sp. CG09_land_8_20_14_0_10_71_15 TaxID=1975532 RepID=UPI000CCAEAC7|nr:septum site-determining protein MinC [Methylobacterium sp. CG09_land_8_20_14_0_10_71_15]PIU04852.1 MAG: septum formation inhibitor MinC [Methylobacterium sp. CG09_land_8_20_14_0_10_71_15]
MAVTKPLTDTAPLAFRGRAFKALALAPRGPLPEWLAGLDAALARSPTLLDGRALILDVAECKPDGEALAALMADLAGRGIRVLGIEGAEPGLAAESLPPFLLAGRPVPNLDVVPVPEKPSPKSLTIEGSIRSGRSVVHHEGDVTVMGSVSSGAEVLAGGSIHVYGALRGRAISGAARNPRARIYCRKFEPELLGIDRLVRTAEDLNPTLRGKPAQIWLDGGALRIAGLD